jgi:hypothetical protein
MAKRKLTVSSDLKPAPYNPRRIEPAAMTGLQSSVERFGDISGIVWNSRSGHVVSGHQRIQALEARGAVFQDSPPAFLLGDRVFPVRVVDWDEPTEKAANLTANNPNIAGEWTDGLQDLLDDLAGFEGFDDLRLDALVEDNSKEDGKDQSDLLRDSFEIIVECDDEQHQLVVIDLLTKAGVKCRALM